MLDIFHSFCKLNKVDAFSCLSLNLSKRLVRDSGPGGSRLEKGTQVRGSIVLRHSCAVTRVLLSHSRTDFAKTSVAIRNFLALEPTALASFCE